MDGASRDDAFSWAAGDVCEDPRMRADAALTTTPHFLALSMTSAQPCASVVVHLVTRSHSMALLPSNALSWSPSRP